MLRKLTISVACMFVVMAMVAAAAPLTAQTNREGGVTVTVTPRNLSPRSASWDFNVTLETHTQPLSQDLTRAALLVDAQGKQFQPLAWDGDPPGGHHRRGVLRFRPLTGDSASVELRILGVGGVEVRTFRWRLE